MTRPVSEHDQPHIRSPLEGGCTNIPLTAAGAQANEAILVIGDSSQTLPRFVHPDPPELIRSWKISVLCAEHPSSGESGFHDRSFDDNAGSDIFPQRHQQLARERDDQRLLHATAVAVDPVFEPQGQGRLRLMTQP